MAVHDAIWVELLIIIEQLQHCKERRNSYMDASVCPSRMAVSAIFDYRNLAASCNMIHHRTPPSCMHFACRLVTFG